MIVGDDDACAAERSFWLLSSATALNPKPMSHSKPRRLCGARDDLITPSDSISTNACSPMQQGEFSMPYFGDWWIAWKCIKA